MGMLRCNQSYADWVMEYPHYDLDIASRRSLHAERRMQGLSVDSILLPGALEEDRDSYGGEDTSSAYEESRGNR
jgi:hypothetical protein